MSQYKKIVLLSLAVVSSGFNGISFGIVESEEMGILPIFDESGKIVDTPMGRLDQVRDARPSWGKGTLPESKKRRFKEGEAQIKREKERRKKMVERKFDEKETELERQEIQAKINVMMEKIKAWHNPATTQKAKDIFEDKNWGLHKKLKKLKRLADLVNEEFDKLDFVKNPGKYDPAQISDQEDEAFRIAVENMDKKGWFGKKRGWRRDGHHNTKDGHHKERRVVGRTGCEHGMCRVTNN